MPTNGRLSIMFYNCNDATDARNRVRYAASRFEHLARVNEMVCTVETAWHPDEASLTINGIEDTFIAASVITDILSREHTGTRENNTLSEMSFALSWTPPDNPKSKADREVSEFDRQS